MSRTPTLPAVLALLGLIAGSAARADNAWPASYPEGPLWHEGSLYYTEMVRDRVMRRNAQGLELFWSEPGCHPTSIAPYGKNGFVILCHRRDSLVKVDPEGNTLARFRADKTGRRFINPNDSSADGHGGVYFSASGQFDLAESNIGSVYYLSLDGIIRWLVHGLRYSNGVVVDRRRNRLFVSEHLNRRVWVHRISAPGRIEPGRTYVKLDDLASRPAEASPLAGPDGLEIDAQGNLYIAEYGTGRLLIVGSDKRLRHLLPWSQKFITNVSFGASEQTLYLTGASTNSKYPFPGLVERLANPVPLPGR